VSDGTGRSAAEPEPGDGAPGRNARDTPDGPDGRERRWRITLAGLVGLFVVLSGAGIFSLSASGQLTGAAAAVSSSPAATTPARAQAPPASSPASRPAPHALPLVSVAAFGPEGTSDGDHPYYASRVIRAGGQPWYTSWYATPEFGDLQAGTGLLVDLGQPAAVSSVRLVLGPSLGADVQVRVGDHPTLDGLATVASTTGAGGTVRLTASSPASGRYVLVWFTRLPPNSNGQYQVDVYGVTVDGTE
jgi:hypothetical protein